MTSARNHLPLLSGNKWLLLTFLALTASACSPRVNPVISPTPIVEHTELKKAPDEEHIKAAPPTKSIALLLPLELDNLNSGGQYNGTTLSHADLALDFYQGFKMALDTLASRGYNYKLQLFDTKDQPSEAQQLAYNATIRSSNLVIGPVFPDDLHAFADSLSGPPKLIVSPLSPASPAHINNNNLVTVATPLEYHARAAAKFIDERYKVKKVFILKSGYSEENVYITPFKNELDSITKNRTKIVATVIQHGQLDGLVPQLSNNEENIFVVPSTNQAFLEVTLRSLDSLSKKYKVTLFGHPSWSKFSYLKPELLQDMKTHLTSTDKADRKSARVKEFIRDYIQLYHTEPNYYAMMGYDEGLFFGSLLNTVNAGELDKTEFKGLLNRYQFVKKPGQGWINTHVNMLHYENLELKRVE